MSGEELKPAAWLYEIPGTGVWRLYRTRYVSPQAVAEGWTETPLYAHPLPEQPREGDAAAEIASLKQRLESAEEALRKIAASRFGLQGIQEDYGRDINAYNFHAMKYWAEQRRIDQGIALSALQQQEKQNG